MIQDMFNYLQKLHRLLFPRPAEAILDISNSCNAFCPFCTRQLMDKPPQGFMSEDVLERIIGQLRRWKSLKDIRMYSVGEHTDSDKV